MTVYPKTNVSTSEIAWANPIEPIWQGLAGDAISMRIWKQPDIGVSDRLIIGAVMNTPQEKRDWGIVRWLREVYQVSRPTLYRVGKRTKAEVIFETSLSPYWKVSSVPAALPKPSTAFCALTWIVVANVQIWSAASCSSTCLFYCALIPSTFRSLICKDVSPSLEAFLNRAINGFCEEIFWRGMFVKVFPDNFWLGIVYPAIGFTIWHFIPQSVFSADNVYGFVVSALFLGLVYGFIAYHTGSAQWTAISHSGSATAWRN